MKMDNVFFLVIKELKTKPSQEAYALFDCEWCGFEVEAGDQFYFIGHERLCPNCYKDLMDTLQKELFKLKEK